MIKKVFKNMNKKKLIVILIAIVLNVSMLFTYALYRKTLTGNGTLDSATWTVNQTGANSIALTGGGEESYTVTVTSNSEIDLKYSIELTNIPNGIEVRLDCGDYVTITNNQITFTDVGRLLYTGSTVSRNHEITFKTPINQSEVASQNVNVKVNFVQDLCSGSNCDSEINTDYACERYAFGEPIESSTTKYTTLNKNVFIAKKGTQKSVCVVRNNTLNCFKRNNWTEEQNHIQQVFSDVTCTTSSSNVYCYASDFSCYIYSDNRIGCDDYYTNDYCEMDANGVVDCDQE